MIAAWYYLHVNGELICKPNGNGVVADIRDSDLARGLWACEPTDRAGAWSMLVEALAAGARPARIRELAEKWSCNDKDAAIYAQVVGCVLQRDGDAWMAGRLDFENVQESPVGFGNTCLEAMAELAKKLGYVPSKMWGATFRDLLRA